MNGCEGNALNNRWKDFEVGDRSESTLLRLLDRLPDAACHSNDAYGAYLACEQAQCGQGRRSEQEGGLRSVLRGKLNRLARRAKGCAKTDGMLTLSIALAWLKLGWI